MQRLYSTFAGSWPGIGLLLMRLVVGTVLLVGGGVRVWDEPTLHTTVPAGVLMVSGLFLIAGLWTPLAGTIVAVIEIFQMPGLGRDPVSCLLAGTIGGALAMLGPGRWSVDARLFGWKRVDVSPMRNSPTHSNR